MHANDVQRAKLVKFDLLARGARLSNEALQHLEWDIKTRTDLRSGLSSGIDVILPPDTWVNVPISEPFTRNSHYLINWQDGKFVLEKGNLFFYIRIPRQPSYYGEITSDGTPLRNIGALRGDRLSIAIDKTCIFWESRKLRCGFCAIGATSKKEPKVKRLEQILEVISHAFNDPIYRPEHLYLNCGFQAGTDSGIVQFAKIVKAIKQSYDIHIHLNPGPPRKKQYIDSLHATGLDEISFNVDIFDPHISKNIIPGKYELRSIFFEMLEYAVKIFGYGKVSSCLVIGLESVESTLEGIDFLRSLGVIPKLSCFRPLSGSLLEYKDPPSLEFLLALYFATEELRKKKAFAIGPLCHACQLHSIV